jgi:hypothetical protein
MRLYNLSVAGLIMRFHIIMIIIVMTGFAGHYLGGAFWFLGLLAFPVLMSCLLGMTFDNKHITLKKPDFNRHLPVVQHQHHTAH